MRILILAGGALFVVIGVVSQRFAHALAIVTAGPMSDDDPPVLDS